MLGLQAGDEIVVVNGRDVSRLGSAEAYALYSQVVSANADVQLQVRAAER